MPPAARRQVVLHFDLNRTILMSDAAGGRTMENTVNYLLAECTWGHVDPADPTRWRCVSTASSIAPPPVTDPRGPPLLTYKQFVDDALPYKSLADADDIEALKAFNKAAKKQRTALQSAFTGPDGPGAQVRGSFDEVMTRLHFPPGPQREAAAAAAAAMTRNESSSSSSSRLAEAWGEGRYYLLPSFVRLLAYLGGLGATHDVRLVFRTFGEDLPDVARELALLVDGTHPMLRGPAPVVPVGSIPAAFGLACERAHDDTGPPPAMGTFYRDGPDAAGTALALGTLRKVPFGRDAPTPEAFYADQGPVEIVRGFAAIQTRLQELLATHATLALRDYWEWWSAHAEHADAGKLLLVDTATATEGNDQTPPGPLTVFFDDHVEAHDAHIVDVRDVTTGHSVPFAQSRGRFLQRVEPFAAITDVDYFVRLVQGLLRE